MIDFIRKKDWYIGIKCDDKEFMQFKQWKFPVQFILNYRGVKMGGGGGGEMVLNKWNH